MSITTKSNKRYAVFLSHDDLFHHEIFTDKHGYVTIPKLISGDEKDYYNLTTFNDSVTYKREVIGYNRAYTDDYGEVINNYQRYVLYVHGISLSLMSEQEILQIFELCKSLVYGNYFNIPQRIYGKFN